MDQQANSQPRVGARVLFPGLALSAALAFIGIQVGRIGWLNSHGMSALTIAIVLGIVVGNTVYGRAEATLGPGVNFSKQTLLRAAVILYGLRLTLQDVGQVGFAGVLIDILVVSSTFALSCVLGTRLFGLDRETATLIGAGSAICGAAAVMATAPVVRGKADQVTVAVATVVVFGTLAMFLYPELYALNLHWTLLPSGPEAFGVYAGSTIHEVAQVFAAGHSISAATADTAVITKMVRVMLLAPFLLGLSTWLGRVKVQTRNTSGQNHARPPRELVVPWFAFGFIGMVIFNSLSLLPSRFVTAAVTVDTFLLATAMAALGLTTHASSIRRAGARPLLLATVLFAWLVIGGGLINDLVTYWIH